MCGFKSVEDRCSDCCYLVEGDNGEWLCENCYYGEDVKDIHDIADEDCPVADEWLIPDDGNEDCIKCEYWIKHEGCARHLKGKNCCMW